MKLDLGARVDRYIVESLLGEGGMAEVYRVRHTRLGSVYALKILVRASELLSARLLREGRAQARLQHPHLLPVRDILEVEGRPALLMPLVEGPTLQALLQVHRPSLGEALALLRCILEGLSLAHSSGVVHRDLKPANILQKDAGDLDGSRETLVQGLSIMQTLGDRYSLAIMLADRAILEAEARQEAVARASFEEARSMANTLRASPDSVLGGKLAEAERLLDQIGTSNTTGTPNSR